MLSMDSDQNPIKVVKRLLIAKIFKIKISREPFWPQYQEENLYVSAGN